MKLFRYVALLATFAFVALAPAVKSSPLPAEWTILPVPAPADTQVVRVAPNRPDWTYAPGEPVTFRVTLAVEPYPTEGIPIQYRLGPEQFEGPEQKTLVFAGGLELPASTLAEPGFLRCIATATLDGKSHRGLATAGFAPEKIRPTQTEPADFDAFWTAQKAVLAQIPADPQLIPAPDRSTEAFEVFHFNVQNVGGWAGPSRIHGVLCVPRGPGPFPAVLYVPGAGVRGYKGRTGLAEKGFITLEIGIHGLPVNLAPEVYSQLSRGALDDYARFNLDDRNRYYYRRVYLGCLRANDYLTAHPKWDGKNLVVMGGSQGGQLSIVTAALDSRVTALAVEFPAYSDVTGYLHHRAGGWPGFFRPGRDGTPVTLAADDPRLITCSYYDTVNFARRVKIPGHYLLGYNDEVCPPTSLFAAYNVITAPKVLIIAPQQGHTPSDAQAQHRQDWVLHQAGAPATTAP